MLGSIPMRFSIKGGWQYDRVSKLLTVDMTLHAVGLESVSEKIQIWTDGRRGWKEYAILEAGGFEVRSSEHVEFNSDTLLWLAIQRLEAHPLHQDEAWARIFAVSGANNVGTGDVFI
jgi:hypothetical protein